MIDLVRFEPCHYGRLRPRAYERRFMAEVGDRDAYATALASYGVSFSLLAPGGAVLGCMGILPLQPGVGEAWLILSTAFPVAAPSRRWAVAARLAEQELTRAMTDDFHRVQTAIPLDFPAGQRFAARLGFRSEGVMRQYGADRSDFLRFARTL
jgi:hypothetical protein